MEHELPACCCASMKSNARLVLLAAALSACSTAPEASLEPKPQPAPAHAAEEPPAARPSKPALAGPANEADLTFTGPVHAKLSGPGATCGKMLDGPSFRVRSEDYGVEPKFEFSVVGGRSDWSGKGAAVILNLAGPPKQSWARNLVKPAAGDEVKLEAGERAVSIHLTLKPVAAGAEPMIVQGTIRCQ